MPRDQIFRLEGHRVLACATDGPALASGRDAANLLSVALSERIAWVLLPRTRLAASFFDLKSGLAGEALQKFANYQVSLAILGDFSAEAAASEALSAFILESNRGKLVWFVRDLGEFEDRLRQRLLPDLKQLYRVRCAENLGADDIEGLARVLIDCVEGGASIGFMPPMTHEKATSFWSGVAASAARGERVVFIAEDAAGILGTVQLVWAAPENQPHRADIAKMQVHRRARRRGVGAALLAAAEARARIEGKTVLVLDTVTDSEGFRLYTAQGWQRVGEIPDYALWPNGELCPTTYFYKLLRGSGRGV